MQSENHADAPLTPALIFEMLQGASAHRGTESRNRSGCLPRRREGPGDVASIARHCKASERGIRILCDFLTINGVLIKEDGHYRHTPSSAAFLDPARPHAWLPSRNSSATRRCRTLRTSRRGRAHGRTVLPGDGTVEPENPSGSSSPKPWPR